MATALMTAVWLMADRPIEPDERADYPASMEARVAVLEQIAKTTIATLDRLERRLESFESSLRADLRELRTDFRWLLGIMLGGFAGLLGVMAHGFHWL